MKTAELVTAGVPLPLLRCCHQQLFCITTKIKAEATVMTDVVVVVVLGGLVESREGLRKKINKNQTITQVRA